jgi:acyl-coenzyme A thioesterase PaaI-like protein
MAVARVEGTLGVRVEEITEEHLLVGAPLPRRDGRLDPMGVLALSCVLSDTGSGIASSIGQAYGDGGATVELRMDLAGPPHPDASRLQVAARRLSTVGGAALSESVLRDDLGTVLGRARGHFALSFSGSVFESDDLPPPDGRERALELCDALALEPGDDPTERVVDVPGLLANSRGHLHGGLAIALAQQVQGQVRGADLSDAAGPPRLVSMTMDYLRPAICDGTPLTFRTDYVRRGRRFSTVRTEVVRADGRVADVATGLWTIED